MTDDFVEALIVLDVISDFDHADGDRLLASFRERVERLEAAISHARARGITIVYVNDSHGRWDGERSAHIGHALAAAGADVVRRVTPEKDDPFLFKGTYSAFNHTALRLLIGELGVTRIVLTGAATEMCVAQTAIDAREDNLQVTVLRDACVTVDADNESMALEYLARVTGSAVTTVDRWSEGDAAPPERQ
jgi:nicotinamidase-related amidase